MDFGNNLNDENIRPIDSIELNTWPNSGILEYSALGKDSLGIAVPDLYESLEPKKGGLIDLLMGTTQNDFDCQTCGLNSAECIGHFGHIVLAEPVFHMGYIDFVKKILQCVCLKCSKLLVYKNEDELLEMVKTKTGKARFAEIRNISKNVTYCQRPNYGCGTPVSKIKKEAKKTTCSINLVAELNVVNVTDGDKHKEEGEYTDNRKKVKQILTPEICYDILKNISDIDCLIMGFDPKKSRPEDMIYKIFPVPPVAVRPSTKADFLASSTMEDDLTHKIADIVKANTRIRSQKESTNETAVKFNQQNVHLLQYSIASYYDNESSLIPKCERRGKVFKSLTARLKGKEGRIRGNLMGKRVDFSARTVITPDPTIDVNELGMPKKIAMNLTFPEIVTPYNIERLDKLVRNGRDKYPGANFVFQSNNSYRKPLHIDLRYRKDKIELKLGDIVERHIVSGDYVLLNRQPTLHKLSMMGHKIKVIDNDDLSTFRLCPNVTKPYNADFDGDEMNVFLPQSEQTKLELEEIADVKKQIITPATSVPIIGAVQDNMLGAYNLTAPNMRIPWKDAMNIISYTNVDDFSSLKKNKEYTGQELFSLIIPKKINTVNAGLKVENGVIIEGQLKSAHLGSKKAGSLIHLTWDQYGDEVTKTFLDNMSRLVNNFNLVRGFTVGIGDIIISKEVQDQKHKIFETKKLQVNHMITEMENNPDLLDAELFEKTTNEELTSVRDDVSKLTLNSLDVSNNFSIMINAGSKGDVVNVGQMGGCLGQQAVEGKRIQKKLNNRSLPFFAQHDDSAVARGFIEQSFLEGMSPISFIFHNMASREGLIDTAIKSVTGDTPIVISENGIARHVLIGDWIDGLLEINKNKVKHYKERELELLELEYEVDIPTTDENGKVSWGNIKNITRHDPGKELYKIQTLGGRDVIVTESKSLLIWNADEKKFLMKSTPKVKVGDFVPVTMNLPVPNKINDNIIDILDKKFKLDDAITASNEIIIELLEMYFIGATITENSIKIKTTSKQLLISLNMLLSRLGVFGSIKIDLETYILSVEDKWAEKLNKILNLKDLNFISTSEQQFQEHNDVVLDAIVSIEKVDVAKYPKVYDLTVPSTLNFGLANGLHVVDTAESGYIQRKLIKSMEDAMIKYDLTVRNANNTIIQFMYGDSGTNAIRQSSHKLQLLTMGNKEIEDKYKFTDNELSNFKNYSKKDNEEFYRKLLKMRDDLRINKLKVTLNYINMENTFTLPVNLNLIISNEKSNASKDKSELDPSYIIKKLDDILEYKNTKLSSISKVDSENKKSLKYRDEITYKTLLLFAMYEFLAPKVAIYNLKLDKGKFDSICEEIISNFNKSIIEPGEMVGTIAAQSIGEPVTQLTLNSLDWNDRIYISENGKIITEAIGNYIDDKVNKWPTTKLADNPQTEMGDTYYIDSSDKNLFTISVNKDGKLSWNKITALTKHLPMNSDGTDDLIKITTKSNRTVTATKAKSFLIVSNNEIIPIRGDELKIGMQVPVLMKLPNINESFEQIHYDDIVSIELVKPTKQYVYDFTVENDKTFITFSGILVYDTFHHSGIGGKGTATLGVPRVKELLSFSTNMKTPIMSIYLERDVRNNIEIANKVASYLKHTTLGDVRDKVDIFYDPDPFAKDGFMERDNVYNVFYSHNPTRNSCQTEVATLPWLIRVVLNREKMMSKDITILDIKSKFCSNWEHRYKDVKGIKKEEKQLLDRITQCSILSNTDNDKVPILHIRFDMTEFNFGIMVKFIEVFVDSFKLKGVKRIAKISSISEERIISFENENQEIKYEKQQVIYTGGVNMTDIRYINGIDLTKTISNDVVEIYTKFGIEAARMALYNEIKTVFDSSGNKVNFQHLSILIDIMTNNGILTSVDRHGLNRLETDPFARASFEKTVEQLMTGAVFGEVDHMNSVSSRIMAGLCIKGGTGLCDIILDTNLLTNSEYTGDIENLYKKTYTELSTNAVVDDIINKETEGFFIPE